MRCFEMRLLGGFAPMRRGVLDGGSAAARANNGMSARLPPALENGEPMVRRIREEFHIGTRTPGKGDVVRLNYPAISTDQPKARLAVRDRESDSRTEIPSECWNL
jgi:hypothetical protein